MTCAVSHDLACHIVGHRTIKEDAEGNADTGVMNVAGAAIYRVKIGRCLHQIRHFVMAITNQPPRVINIEKNPVESPLLAA